MTARPKLAVAGAPPRQRLRYAVLCGSVSLVYACSHAWDEYDPRLTGGVTGRSSASGSSSGATDRGRLHPERHHALLPRPAQRREQPALPRGRLHLRRRRRSWGTDCCTGEIRYPDPRGLHQRRWMTTATASSTTTARSGAHRLRHRADRAPPTSSTAPQRPRWARWSSWPSMHGSALGPAEDGGGTVLLDASTGVFTVALDSDGGTTAAERSTAGPRGRPRPDAASTATTRR